MVLNGYKLVKSGDKYFLGEYCPSFTKGNRLALPKKMREVIGKDEIILVRGLEKCIYGFDQTTWEQESKKHIDLSIFDASSRKLKRYLYSGASSVPLDKQGRFVIPQNLIDYAELDETLYVIGAGDHFEVWSQKNWNTHLTKISVELSD